MKKMYIQSWFLLNRSVIIGFLSGLILTSILFLANFFHAQRSHARERAAALDRFFAESAAFQALARGFLTEQGKLEIPEDNQFALGAALARLAERASSVLLSEKVSPLKHSAIQKRGAFASPIARAERTFDLAFVPFVECSAAAYHTHNSIPYLTEQSERQAAQSAFLLCLQDLFGMLQPASTLSQAYVAYRGRIDRFLGARQTAKASRA